MNYSAPAAVFTAFFSTSDAMLLVETAQELLPQDIEKLQKVLKSEFVSGERVRGTFIGPRREMITPWSTNATEIAASMGVHGVRRIEQFRKLQEGELPSFDPMLEAVYQGLTPLTLRVDQQAASDSAVDDIESYNTIHGLALSDEEVAFLKVAATTLGRALTDSEVYGFAQINSEHCRHKIFNGEFVIDGKKQEKSLFQLIKDTSKASPQQIVSAYKDNVAFMKGASAELFAPTKATEASFFEVTPIQTVVSLKAETHNFPTTVEPFFGASTGSGGEIRDRMAGGRGSIPLAGTAVYMTAYPRLSGSLANKWECLLKERDWKYQTPTQILIKASNGASDFGNKFGQPLIVGSVLTFEQRTSRAFYGYDRTVMLAGGVGYARAESATKAEAQKGDRVVVFGGDNYRIGMAGSSVSSVDTGAYSTELELSAVQRANPEMQKRVCNVIRAVAEKSDNPIRSIHDHGAGGHMNCLAELVEPLGGEIDMNRLPVGDPTLASRELLSNESQERMGLLVPPDSTTLLEEIAKRERAPMYDVGEITGNEKLVFHRGHREKPVDLPLSVLLGSAPKTILEDRTQELDGKPLEFSISNGKDLLEAIESLLSLEAVACKDWLTNKVDRSVSGKVAVQQCAGPFQLPLNNCGVVAIDQIGSFGIATSIGHAPVAGLIHEAAGSLLSVAEALTNIVWAPLAHGLAGVALSANWMWPAKQSGENSRLYHAVSALSEFCISLGIPVPTGKDSLSMTMNYSDGLSVRAPGTVVVSASALCDKIADCVTPDLKPIQGSRLLYVNLSGLAANPLGGSSFAQTLGQLGSTPPTVTSADTFAAGFALIQALVRSKEILAGHDVSSGGLITTLLEMAFVGDVGIDLSLSGSDREIIEFLFCEKPGVVLQLESNALHGIAQRFADLKIPTQVLGEVRGTMLRFHAGELSFQKPVADLRRSWFKPSYLLDLKQTKESCAKERFETFATNPLSYIFPDGFEGEPKALGIDLSRKKSSGLKAAIIREKGTNGDRELAYALHVAGFDVKDITMWDLVEGRENLEDISFLAFPGGFSNSDVLGAAVGWAATFQYNPRAFSALQRFYERPDTLSIGVCNGCQLMAELELIHQNDSRKIRMNHNESGKFESCFVNVRIQESPSILMKPLIGTQLGVWVAHGEGRFTFSEDEDRFHVPVKFCSSSYPANPNGSQFNAAAVCSDDGRHLAIMPHLERSLFGWNWPYRAGKDFVLSPWILSFLAARDWLRDNS